MHVVTPVELKRLRVFLIASSELSYGCRVTVGHDAWDWFIADTHGLCTFEMRHPLPLHPGSDVRPGQSYFHCLDVLASIRVCMTTGQTVCVMLRDAHLVWCDANGQPLCETSPVDSMVLDHRVSWPSVAGSDFSTPSQELTADLSNVNVFSGLSTWSIDDGEWCIQTRGPYGRIKIRKPINRAGSLPGLLIASKMLKTTMVAFNKSPMCRIQWPRSTSEPLVVKNEYFRCCLSDLMTITKEFESNVF